MLTVMQAKADQRYVATVTYRFVVSAMVYTEFSFAYVKAS